MTSRIWYIVAVAVFLAGISAAGILAWSAYSNLDRSMDRVVVPGSKVLSLDEPGTYTIYHETHSVVDGRVYASETISGMRVHVTDEAGGAAIPVTTPTGTTRYSTSGHTGVSVLAFEIGRPGRYRIDAGYDGGRTEPAVVLAIGQLSVGGLVMTIFGAIGSAVAGVIGGIVIALITYFTRDRARRRAAGMSY